MNEQELSLGLAKIRKRRAQLWAAFWGYLPAMFLVGWAAQALGFGVERIVVVAALGWMALSAVTYFRAVRAPCPRCGKPFSHRDDHPVFVYRINLLSLKCLNCGLPLRDQERESS